MPELPKNIFVISQMINGKTGRMSPRLLKFHQGKNYRYSLMEYADANLAVRFRKKMHMAELEKAIANSLQGKQKVEFDELSLSDAEVDRISKTLKAEIGKRGYDNVFPTYVKRQRDMKNTCSFPIEMLNANFTRVY